MITQIFEEATEGPRLNAWTYLCVESVEKKSVVITIKTIFSSLVFNTTGYSTRKS